MTARPIRAAAAPSTIRRRHRRLRARWDGPGTDGLEDTDFEDDGVLDSSDTLEDSEDPYEDPLDPGVEPADKWSAGERFGDTLAEEREGESLDQLLAEETRSRTRTPILTRRPRATCPGKARNPTTSSSRRPPGSRG